MSNVTEWLAWLGLSEYTRLFAENRIDDLGVLPHLTEQDLKDIGIPLGHWLLPREPCDLDQQGLEGLLLALLRREV